MMDKKISEYDAFGPWIYIIDDEHELPKLFKPYENDLSGALMTFKIPRKIERRRANPNMHLYDRVVGVFKSHILVLTRDEDMVYESQIQISEIVAIEHSHFLLLGKVILYIENDIFEIEYNTVSVDTMEQFVDLLRTHIKYTPKPINMQSLEYDTKTIDYLFAHLVDEFKEREPGIKMIAYQRKHELKTKKDFFSRLMDKLSGNKMLTCIAFLANDEEIIVISRSSPIKKDEDQDYAYTYLYLPTKNIVGAQIWGTEDDNGVYELRLEVKNHDFAMGFTNSNVGIAELKNILTLQTL